MKQEITDTTRNLPTNQLGDVLWYKRTKHTELNFSVDVFS